MSNKFTFLRIIRLCLPILLISILISGFEPRHKETHPKRYISYPQEENDSLIWQTAMRFTTYFNKRDTASMNRLLPEDFMLQLLHDNFLGKKILLNMMMDTAVQSTFQHYLKRSALTLIR